MYYLTEDNKFVIENYNWQTSFSNFFPGIAGELGIPMWIYYVSRNQGICSMGVRDKNNPLMEFLSFNKALQVVGQQGFRTFIKTAPQSIYEPFKKTEDNAIIQKMITSSAELEITEENQNLGLEFKVTYFPLVNTSYPALIRILEIKNLKDEDMTIELLDGIPKFLPKGVDLHCLQTIARHIEGMMSVFFYNGVPLYRLKQTPADIEEVGDINGGNFYLTFNSMTKEINHNKYIVDPYRIFEECEIYDFPWHFKHKSIEEILKQEQIKQNRTPCAFTGELVKLNAKGTYTLISFTGNAINDEKIDQIIGEIKENNYMQKKRNENLALIESIKNYAFTLSANKNLNEYCRQTFLDNVIRGGMPLVFETAENKTAFYVYSRQNGDLERDYHFFVLEPTYFSQGTGHYRSVNQNRRCDTWFFPQVQDKNIVTFVNLIQTDGYNPLEVNQLTYSVKDLKGLENWLSDLVKDNNTLLKLMNYLSKPFTPGEFLMKLEQNGIEIKSNYKTIISNLLSFCNENDYGGLHEGFWVDHWFYNSDLIDNFLMIYPDKLESLLIKNNEYYFYDDPDIVKPRDEKYVLTPNGVRQYKAVIRDKNKIKMINSRNKNSKRMRTKYGEGDVYYTNLLTKILCMVTNRLATLDPANTGMEMESDKPGWNDSMNGLPGILGSSLCETLELERALKFLSTACDKLTTQGPLLVSTPGILIKIYEELNDFMERLQKIIEKRLNSEDENKKFIFWDESHTVKEEYREKTKFGISGEEKIVQINKIKEFANTGLSLINEIFNPANRNNIFNEQGVCYTYFENQVTKFQNIKEGDNNKLQEGSNYPLVKPLQFSQKPLPLFLEGPVHLLKVHEEFKEQLYKAVKNSKIYDKKLNMYKVCEPLDNAPFEIGRVKAWGAGWIENESVYTHMLYKYLLGVLESGLYEEFFNDIKTMLTPYLNPSIYGRSIFENVSFIVSSAFPDKRMHGQGLQPRLSGVTGEMIDIWILMVAGKNPFFTDDSNNLNFKLSPILPEWLFTRETKTYFYSDINGKNNNIILPDNCFAAKLFGDIFVVYYNNKRKNTFGPDGVSACSYKLYYKNGQIKEINEPVISSPYSLDIRERKIEKIEVILDFI